MRDSDLCPARALLTPAWILALGLLLVNDLWLKQAGLLPLWLTGKLSDVAGMIVAPVLLAIVIRARRHRALVGCHVVVGVVFAGIQLSPELAAAWTSVTAALGHPWVITRDPSDLLALPVLLLSHELLTPAMRPDEAEAPAWRRPATVALATLGLWSSLASGVTIVDFYPPIVARMIIHNGNEHEVIVAVRYLRDDVEIDCARVAEQPGALISDAAFAEPIVWAMPERTTIALDLDGECDVAWIGGPGIEPRILFNADPDAFEFIQWPGQIFGPEELLDGALVVTVDSGGRGTWSSGDTLLLYPPAIDDEPPTVEPGCEPAAGESRIEWSPHEFELAVEVVALELGVDDCYAFELQARQMLDGVIEDSGEPFDWLLCVPDPAVMPFFVGDSLAIDDSEDPEGARRLSMIRLDSATLEPAGNDAGGVVIANYVRGGSSPEAVDAPLGRELVAVPPDSCAWQTELGCATVERPARLQLVDSGQLVEIGVPTTIEDWVNPLGVETTAILAYMRERAVVDPECSEGAAVLDHDIDLAVVTRSL